MDQDDPEKRIAELEQQLSQPPPVSAAPGPGTGGRTPRFGAKAVRILAILLVAGGVYFFPVGCLNYITALRTPTTTATITRCDNETTCYGSWKVGRMPQTGRIYGDLGDHPTGSQVDVHLSRGRAYAGHESQAPLILLMSGSSVALVTGVILWWSLRRKYKSR